MLDEGAGKLTVEPMGQAVRVCLEGVFDHVVAEEVRQRIEDTLPEREQPLLLNLQKVVYMSSAGIGLLVSLAGDYTVRLINPPGDVRRLLGLAEVLSMFVVHPTEEAALAELAKGGGESGK